MSCCGAKRVPGMSPSSAIVLGSESGVTVYARVQAGGDSLSSGLRVGDQRYFTGTGAEQALIDGLLLDVSASAVRARRSHRHEFLVVCDDGERERFAAWRDAQMRARMCGGRIEVVTIEEDSDHG